jgi:ribonucleoside-triphosphate reductase
MVIAKDSLVAKRAFLEKMTDEGLYPYLRNCLKKVKIETGEYFAQHFSTIGIIGMHEACQALLGVGIDSEEGRSFAIRVLKLMREKAHEFQVETNSLFNIEATPAEGTTHDFALRDNHIKPYYTNSTHLPVDCNMNLFEMLDHQDELQTLYNGGTIVHLFLGESSPDHNAIKDLVRKVATNYKLPYFSITPTFSICSEHGYICGNVPACPDCGRKTEVYSRVVGYLKFVDQFNDGKAAEFADRTVWAADGSVAVDRPVDIGCPDAV